MNSRHCFALYLLSINRLHFLFSTQVIFRQKLTENPKVLRDGDERVYSANSDADDDQALLYLCFCKDDVVLADTSGTRGERFT